MKVNFYSLILSIFFLAGLSGMSGCQKNKTEIMLDGQDTVSESETQDDTQAGNDATEDLAEAKISAEAELSEMPVETEPEMIFVDVCGAVMNPGVYELDGSSRVFQAIEAAGGFLPEAAASAVNQASRSVTDSRFMYLRRKKRKRELYLRQYSRRIRDLRQQMQMV